MNYDSTEDANFKRDCFENNIKRTKCYANREQLAFSTYTGCPYFRCAVRLTWHEDTDHGTHTI